MNCAALENTISGDLAVRREFDRFELMQIWITDDEIKDLADTQLRRMLDRFDTIAIPLHVIVDPDGNELARFEYSPLATPRDYLEFLREGMDAYKHR